MLDFNGVFTSADIIIAGEGLFALADVKLLDGCHIYPRDVSAGFVIYDLGQGTAISQKRVEIAVDKGIQRLSRCTDFKVLREGIQLRLEIRVEGNRLESAHKANNLADAGIDNWHLLAQDAV